MNESDDGLPTANTTESSPIADTAADDNTARSSGQTLDLAEWTRTRILPGAAELCEQGKLRERMQEVDGKGHVRRHIDCVYLGNGVYATTGSLPHNIGEPVYSEIHTGKDGTPIMIGFGLAVKQGVHFQHEWHVGMRWLLVRTLLRRRVFRREEDARRYVARELELRLIGGG